MTSKIIARAANVAVVCLALAATTPAAAAPILIVGLDEKATWSATGRPVYAEPGRDAVAILDLERPEAPRIVATLPLENSVTGPPVNLAITPDDGIALVANAVTNVASPDGGFAEVPANQLFVIDLKTKRPRVAQTLAVGKQPSGLNISPAGTLALVAYRGERSIGVFRIARGRVREVGRVEIGGAPSHVAFTPDGRRALAVKQGADKVTLLDVDGERVSYVLDLPTGNGPYNVEMTPEGRFGVISERGALTILDLQAETPRVHGRVTVAAGLEGLAIRPRGDVAVSVALRGSNAPPTSPVYHERGAMVVLAVDTSGLTPLKTVELGRVPEGVGFAPDGRHLYVANYYDSNIWVYRVEGTAVTDTGFGLRCQVGRHRRGSHHPWRDVRLVAGSKRGTNGFR